MRRAARLIGAAACLLAMAPGLRAAPPSPPAGVATLHMEGRLGPWPIGMSVTLRDWRALLAAHYFYASHGVNLPLTGAVAGEAVTLSEPGGGVFHLHLTYGQAHADPLTFYTSTGLAGTWTGGGKSWPVTLGFTVSNDGFEPARRYADITTASDADFEALVRRFLDGVTRGNRDEAAGAVSYPLHVYAQRNMVIRNRAALLAAWDRIFTPATVARLRGAIPHEMFVHDEMAMILNGDVWFDAHGAHSVMVTR